MDARTTDTAGMVLVTRGTYMMGATTATDPDAQSNEQPVHAVTVGPLYLDRTEVTVAAYKACKDSGGAGCTAPGTGGYCNWGAAGKENHPINCVDWNQATAYCAWRGKRLPTEEEWEYAARGSMGSKYPWGNEAPGSQLCWKRGQVPCDMGTCSDGTCEVGLYSSTLFGKNSAGGVNDLAGNVWEWTSIKYCSDYNKNNCNENYVIRGGSWNRDDPRDVRAATRSYAGASYQDSYVGFRCASD